MRRPIRAWLEALLLVAFGAASIALARSDDYVRLMNPTYRWVTTGGGVLVLLMGVALLFRPRRRAGVGALLVFLVFFGIAIAGNPLAPGVAPAMPFGDGGLPAIEREGYEPLRIQALFDGVAVENAAIADGDHVLQGFVYRTEALDREGTFLLLEPVMACCLADAIAVGIRVRTSGELPDPDSWVYAFGRLETLPEPIVVPRFRVGAILFTTVSSTRVLEAVEVLPHRALLPDVPDRVPEARCRRFRAALASGDLAATLRGEGPFTVFALLDAAFAGRPEGELEGRLADYVVPGYLMEADLYDRDRLEALSGRVLQVEVLNGRLFVEGARVLFGDQMGRNGVVHIVHPSWRDR